MLLESLTSLQQSVKDLGQQGYALSETGTVVVDPAEMVKSLKDHCSKEILEATSKIDSATEEARQYKIEAIRQMVSSSMFGRSVFSFYLSPLPSSFLKPTHLLFYHVVHLRRENLQRALRNTPRMWLMTPKQLVVRHC